MRPHAKFREDRLHRSRDMANFRFLKMAAVHHLGFLKVVILDFTNLEISTSSPVWRPNMRHRAKVCEDRLNRSQDMGNFRFFKMAAVLHLGFVLRLLGPPTTSIWWSL